MFFSDKYRFTKVVILAAAILAGCFYAAWLGPQVDPDYRVLIADENNIGNDLIVQYATILSVDKNIALLTNNEYEFRAIFPGTSDLKPNQSISVEGKISSINELSVENYHVHPLRQFKYFFSLSAVVLVIYLLFKKYRFNIKRFIFEER